MAGTVKAIVDARDAILDPFLERHAKTMPIRTMARMLAIQHPELFPTIDSTRQAIQHRMSKHGNKHRVQISRTKWNRFAEMAHETESKWPESVIQHDWKPYTLPDVDGYWLVIADVHIPFHSMKPLMATIKFAKGLGKKLKGILINGDLSDQYASSWWTIDPLVCKLDTEIWAVREFFKKLQEEFPSCQIIWKHANHEKRFERMAVSMHPSLANSEEVRNSMRLMAILESSGNKEIFERITVLKPGTLIQFKQLAILHGDEIGKGVAVPVNAARMAFLKTKACCFISHYHSSSSHVENDIWGSPIAAKSGGCLCDLHPDYSPMAHMRWNHGFALLNTKGEWDLENKKIIEGDKVVSA